MVGIFLLNSKTLEPPLDTAPLVAYWLANGPILQQLLSDWIGLLDQIELWVSVDHRDVIAALLDQIPLDLRVTLVSYDPALGFPAAKIAERAITLPAGEVVLTTDLELTIPGSFDGQNQANSLSIGRAGMWFASPQELRQQLSGFEAVVTWDVWVESFTVSGVYPVDLVVPLWSPEGGNVALFKANRRLLAIGRNSADALERSYIEEFTVIQPVYIDPEAEIYTSVIGPYAAVGPGARVENSVLRHTVIDRGAEVEAALLEMSYIGSGQKVTGQFKQQQTPAEGQQL